MSRILYMIKSYEYKNKHLSVPFQGHENGVSLQTDRYRDPNNVPMALINQDWTALLIRVRDNQDSKAFAALFSHFAPRIKGFLMKSGSSASLAEECVQDVMATLWLKAHLFDPSRASVATWIFTIARNRRIDVIRKEHRPEPEDLPWGPEAAPDQDEAMVIAEDNERLSAAIATLPQNQRALIERAYVADLSHSQLTQETGLPLGTIKSRIRLALERLRHKMMQ
jgi:RNA polymerase sigma factor (sigma-70 family)